MEALNKIKLGIILLATVIIFSTLGLMYLEGWSFFTALYVTIITLSTVGYGDITPTTFWGKAFTLLYVVCGAGAMAYTFVSISGFIIEGQLKRIVRLKKMESKLKSIRNHYIICGFGKIGKIVSKKFDSAGVPYVVIDINEKNLTNELEHYKNLLYVVGDATLDDVLNKAGVKRAKGLIATVNSDAENLFITISAKELNPNIYIIAKAEAETTTDKLIKTGADRVVSPYSIGGLRIAEMALRPEILDFVTTLMDETYDMEIGRFTISPEAEVVGKTIHESKIRQRSGATILAIVNKDGEAIVNPGPEVVLEAHNVVYAFGTKEHLEKLKKILCRC